MIDAPNNAFLTCFSPYAMPTIKDNLPNTFAYSALLKKDLSIDMDFMETFCKLSGIKKLTIIYFNNPDCINEKYIEKVYELSLEINSRRSYECIRFIAGNLTCYLQQVLWGNIDVGSGVFEVKNTLFIFNGYN